MDTPEVRWEHYPLVAEYAAARAFVERLVLKGKRPKTVDAYARAVEDLLTYFGRAEPSRILEAKEADAGWLHRKSQATETKETGTGRIDRR
jgi:hypothetical protein